MSRSQILLTVLLPAHAMASIHACTVLNFTTPTNPLSYDSSSNPLMEGGTATRAIVPCECDDQNATSPKHSNQRKKRPFPNLLFFIVKLWPPKSSCLTPVFRFNNRQATKGGSTFSPRVCDVQLPCRSPAHLFERDNLHRTTGGSLTVSLTRGGPAQSVSRGRGRGVRG